MVVQTRFSTSNAHYSDIRREIPYSVVWQRSHFLFEHNDKAYLPPGPGDPHTTNRRLIRISKRERIKNNIIMVFIIVTVRVTRFMEHHEVDSFDNRRRRLALFFESTRYSDNLVPEYRRTRHYDNGMRLSRSI